MRRLTDILCGQLLGLRHAIDIADVLVQHMLEVQRRIALAEPNTDDCTPRWVRRVFYPTGLRTCAPSNIKVVYTRNGASEDIIGTNLST